MLTAHGRIRRYPRLVAILLGLAVAASFSIAASWTSYGLIGVAKAASPSEASPGQLVTGPPLPVVIQTFPSCDCAWLNYVATDLGLWEKYGLDVELAQVATGPQAIAGLAAGSVNLAILDFTLAGPAIQQGADLMTASGGLLTHWALVAGKDAAIPNLAEGIPASVRDLAGQPVAVNGIGSSTYYFLDALLRSSGMTVDDVEVIPTGGTPQELAAVQSGQVPAGIQEASSTFVLTRQYGANIIFDFTNPNQDLSDYPLLKPITGVPWIGYYGSRSWLEQNAETVKRVQLALMDADVWMHDPAHFDELITILEPRLPAVPDDQRADLVHFVQPMIATYFPDAAAEGWSQFGADMGLTAEVLPINTWVYPGLPQTPEEVHARVEAAAS